uniref:Sec1 family protein n=1 Tax=Panagrolaimus davidi TaxID=227884 RepID=A0A914QD57_9BILA
MPPTAPPKSCTATITRLDQALLFKILDALEGTKTIVWDRFLMTEFNSTVSYQLLKEHNVVSHVCPVINPIVKKTDHILYIIPPYLHSTKELIESHLKKIPEIDRRKHRIYYVPEVSYVHREELISAIPWIDKHIYNLPMRWFPTDHSQFISMNLPTLPPVMLIYEDWNELYKCAKALRQLETQMEYPPKIIYKGKWSTTVAQILEQLRKTPSEEHVIEAPNVDEIIIIDRWLDLATPLMMQQTFSGVADEMYGIDIQSKIKFETENFYKGSKIPKSLQEKPQFDFYLNDEIYPELCDSHMMDVSGKIQYFVRECKEEELKYKSVESVAQISECVNSLPRVIKKREATTSYLQMTTLFMHDMSQAERLDYRKCEEEILENKFEDKIIPYIETCILNAEPLLKILRLISLQSQICNGLKLATLQAYRKSIVQGYGIEVLSWFLRLEMAGLIRCSDKSEKMSTYLPVNFTDLKKRFKLFSTEPPQVGDIARFYNGYVPLLIRILEEGEQADFMNWDFIEPSKNVPLKKKLQKDRLLFIVGGITRAEMGIIKERFPDMKYCCTTATITGNQLIEGLRE